MIHHDQPVDELHHAADRSLSADEEGDPGGNVHGGGAWWIASQQRHDTFGRTCSITLKCPGTYSSTSLLSSPSARTSPPQAGQAAAGRCTTVSRGRWSGSGRRAG